MRSRALIALFAASMLAAKPYEDVRGRFTLEVEQGWRLAPAFGDLFGTRFEREVPEGVARLTIHVDPVGAHDLAEFTGRAARALSKKFEVEVEKRSRVRVGPRDVQLTVLGQKDGPRVVRSYAFFEAGRYFHLFLVSPKSALRSVGPEALRMVRRIRPLAPPVETETEDEAPEAPEPEVDVIGYFEGDSGVVFVLEASGQFRLGGASGRYVLHGDQLALAIPNKPPQRFTVSRPDKETLILASARLVRPMVYRRKVGGELTGRWVARTSGGQVALELRTGGVFQFANLSGRWTFEGGQLTIEGSGGEKVTYRVSLEADRLTLSGGDLDEPLSFRRLVPG